MQQRCDGEQAQHVTPRHTQEEVDKLVKSCGVPLPFVPDRVPEAEEEQEEGEEGETEVRHRFPGVVAPQVLGDQGVQGGHN